MSEYIKEWYNDFADTQIKTSVNLRHYTLFNIIKKYGLKKTSNVLEVGCGIGTLTGLLHRYITKGNITAVDISDKSIKIAQKLIPETGRINFLVSDMTDFKSDMTFDFIILPDVLEHIPLENHRQLFKVLSDHMHDHSQLMIHIPHPKMIEYLKLYHPDKLQIIDQSIHADILMSNSYPYNLLLLEYQSYSLFHESSDYAFMRFSKNTSISYKPFSSYHIVWKKFKERIRFLISIYL